MVYTMLSGQFESGNPGTSDFMSHTWKKLSFTENTNRNMVYNRHKVHQYTTGTKVNWGI